MYNPSSTAEKCDPLIGSSIGGQYRIIRRLGGGGMGFVYLGEHTIIKRRVAIKCLNKRYSLREDVATRFHREALAANAVDSEHIVEVTDMGNLDDGSLFICTQPPPPLEPDMDVDDDFAGIQKKWPAYTTLAALFLIVGLTWVWRESGSVQKAQSSRQKRVKKSLISKTAETEIAAESLSVSSALTLGGSQSRWEHVDSEEKARSGLRLLRGEESLKS